MESKRTTPKSTPSYEITYSNSAVGLALKLLELKHFRTAHSRLEMVADDISGFHFHKVIASFFLGLIYLNGWGIPKDKVCAASHLKTFIDYVNPLLHDAEALQKQPFLIYALGRLCFHDKTFSAPKTAAQYFRWAAELGIVDAVTYLGFCHYEGNSVTKNLVQAEAQFKIAAESEPPSAVACTALAQCYFSHGDEHIEQAKILLGSAIKAGDLEAKRIRAKKIIETYGSELSEVEDLFFDCIGENYGPALNDVAYYCEHDAFPTSNFGLLRQKALGLLDHDGLGYCPRTFYERAAACGWGAAYISLGSLGLDTLSLTRSWCESETPIDYFTKAAEQGIAVDYWLGKCYEHEYFPDRNEAVAFEYYVKAARAGHSDGLARFERITGQVFNSTIDDLWVASYQYRRGKELRSRADLQWMEQADNGGHVPATLALGYYYIGGGEGGGKKAAGFEYFEKIAQKNPEAMTELGKGYLTGKGLFRDPKEAVQCFLTAAQMGFVPAQRLLISEGVKTPLKEAIYWCSRLASQDDAQARARFLAIAGFDYVIYEEMAKKFKKKDSKSELGTTPVHFSGSPSSLFEPEAAISDNPGGRRRNSDAKILSSGSSNPPRSDPENALEALGGPSAGSDDQVSDAKGDSPYFPLSKPEVDATKLYTLGIDYIKGRKVKVDKIVALGFFIEAIIQGNSDAREALLDMQPKMEWCKAAVGDAEAQFKMGETYKIGSQGFAPNMELAVDWYSKAALQGHALAEKALKDLSEYVIAYYETSAEQGNATAQFLWARCYELGLYGIEQNPKNAAIWYEKAAIQKHEAAQLAFKRLALGVKLLEPTVAVPAAVSFKFSIWCDQAVYKGGKSGAATEMTRLSVYSEESGVEPERAREFEGAAEVEMEEIPSVHFG